MEILLGLALGAALLYAWLVGHWFARVLVFLLLTPALGLAVAALLVAGANQQAAPIALAFSGMLGGVAAWFVSGAPVYYWRAQLKRLDPHAYAVLFPPRTDFFRLSD